MTTGPQVTVPRIIMVAGGLDNASNHISMVPINIIQSLVPCNGIIWSNWINYEYYLKFTEMGTLILYRYGVKIVIFSDGHDFRSFRWSCDTRLTLEKVWQQ